MSRTSTMSKSSFASMLREARAAEKPSELFERAAKNGSSEGLTPISTVSTLRAAAEAPRRAETAPNVTPKTPTRSSIIPSHKQFSAPQPKAPLTRQPSKLTRTVTTVHEYPAEPPTTEAPVAVAPHTITPHTTVPYTTARSTAPHSAASYGSSANGNSTPRDVGAIIQLYDGTRYVSDEIRSKLKTSTFPDVDCGTFDIVHDHMRGNLRGLVHTEASRAFITRL